MGDPYRTQDRGTTDPVPAHLSLHASADLIALHRFVERELFGLTGRWSVDGTGAGSDDGVAEFFAVQSANHGWRLEQWTERSPASVDPEVDPLTSAWAPALQEAGRLTDNGARLACWAHVLAPRLAGSYRSHLVRTAAVADAGVIRWLRIAETDVLDGLATAVALLGEPTVAASAGPPPAEAVVAGVLAPFLAPGR